jgi:superfamily II DNA/RNA helicase
MSGMLTLVVLMLLLQCELLDGGLDVLVATPGRLLSHLEKGSLNLQHTAALVMDEVDVLAGEDRCRATNLCS